MPYALFFPDFVKNTMTTGWAKLQKANGMITESLSGGCMGATGTLDGGGGRVMGQHFVACSGAVQQKMHNLLLTSAGFFISTPEKNATYKMTGDVSTVFVMETLQLYECKLTSNLPLPVTFMVQSSSGMYLLTTERMHAEEGL